MAKPAVVVWRNMTVTPQSFERLNQTKALRLHHASFSVSSKDSLLQHDHCHGDTTGAATTKRTLEQLFTKYCQLDGLASEVLAEACKSLTTLKIAHCQINREFASFWNSSNFSSLTTLSLHNVKLEEGSSWQMKDLLVTFRQIPNLQSLCLESCGLGTQQHEVTLLASLVHAQKALATLNVSKNNLDGSMVKLLLDHGIQGHPALTNLILSENPLGDDGANALSSFLASCSCSNSTLQSVSIGDCDLWDEGCKAIAMGMAKFETLRELYLGGEDSSCRGECLHHLAKSMRQNTTLTTLWIGGTCDFLGHELLAWKQVQYFLHLNRAGRKILCNSTAASSLWMKTFVRESKNADLVFYLLRERPSLIDNTCSDRKDRNDEILTVCG